MSESVTYERIVTREARNILEMAERLAYEGDTITPEDLAIDDIDDLDEALDLYRRATRQAQAAKVVAEVCGQQLARLLGEGGAVRMGPTIVRYRKGYTEKCIDPDGFASALESMVAAGVISAGKITNPNNVKKGVMPPALRSTFFDKTDDDEPSLTLVPLSRAPKFLQALDDGDVILGRKEPDDE